MDVVRGLLAVQSQDYRGAKWALAQRCVPGVTDAALDALFDAGAIVRTHVMRPTWHFVAPEDIRWLLRLTAPRVHQANGYQYRSLGIDGALAAQAEDVFVRALEGGRALTREELGGALRAEGIDASGLRLGYLIAHAELEAVLVSGPRRGPWHTFARMDERLPEALDRRPEDPAAELAIRYVRGHGPAQDIDLAWWSGLTLTESRRAMTAADGALRTEIIDGRTFRVPADEAGAGDAPVGGPLVHLLPNYDELLIAFRDRTDALDARLPDRARGAEAILAHVLVRDGLVVGGWKRRDGPRSTALELSPLVPVDDEERAALRAAVDRLSAFLGRPVEISGLD